MTPDSLRAASRHKADDHGAYHRHEYYDGAQVIAGRRNESSAPSQVKEQVGEKADKAEQSQGYEGAENAVTIATNETGITLHVVVKSPRALGGSPFPSRNPVALGDPVASVRLNQRQPFDSRVGTCVEEKPAFIVTLRRSASFFVAAPSAPSAFWSGHAPVLAGEPG